MPVLTSSKIPHQPPRHVQVDEGAFCLRKRGETAGTRRPKDFAEETDLFLFGSLVSYVYPRIDGYFGTKP